MTKPAGAVICFCSVTLPAQRIWATSHFLPFLSETVRVSWLCHPTLLPPRGGVVTWLGSTRERAWVQFSLRWGSCSVSDVRRMWNYWTVSAMTKFSVKRDTNFRGRSQTLFFMNILITKRVFAQFVHHILVNAKQARTRSLFLRLLDRK